jgi:hypothetical protein
MKYRLIRRQHQDASFVRSVGRSILLLELIIEGHDQVDGSRSFLHPSPDKVRKISQREIGSPAPETLTHWGSRLGIGVVMVASVTTDTAGCLGKSHDALRFESTTRQPKL